ncbi:MAG: RNA polymerase sigma factor [Bacteroidia bacterium]
MSNIKQLHPESALIESLKRRDKDAYGKLYDRYGSALYGIIFKIVKSDSLADDVLQESFVKIWKKIDQYDTSKGRFFTWILNIARNTAIDQWRAANRRSTSDLDNPAVASAAGGYEDQPEDQLDASTVLDQLGEPERTLIYLSYLEGYSQSEIAKKLEMPLGTVKTKMRNSLRSLRTMFA